MNRKNIFIIATLLLLVLIVTAFIIMNLSKSTSQANAQQIPQGTYFKQVEKLSVGKKPTCLSHNSTLDQTVQADDKLPYEKSLSPAIGTVIPDMPAGYTDTYLHAYTPTSASGYEVFSDKNQKAFVGNLKSFNFTVERSTANDTWKLGSFIACSK